jgi:plastocyanin
MHLPSGFGALCVALSMAVRASAGEIALSVEDARGRPLPQAVVYLMSDKSSAVHAPTSVIIDQRHKQFIPEITVVQTGTAVSFPNNDSIRHSVYSFSRPKQFQIKLYGGRTPPPVVFDKAGVVAIGCNIHDEMAAWVVVVDTPYFAKTDPSGTHVFTDLAPGAYQAFAWYPEMETARGPVKLVVGEGPTVTARVHLNVTPLVNESH